MQEGFEVCSPKEGQAHRRRGAARILDIGKIRGAGVFGKGKRVNGPGQDEIRSRNDVAPEGRRNEPLPGHF